MATRDHPYYLSPRTLSPDSLQTWTEFFLLPVALAKPVVAPTNEAMMGYEVVRLFQVPTQVMWEFPALYRICSDCHAQLEKDQTIVKEERNEAEAAVQTLPHKQPGRNRLGKPVPRDFSPGHSGEHRAQTT